MQRIIALVSLFIRLWACQVLETLFSATAFMQ
jgi:hypothetical protein